MIGGRAWIDGLVLVASFGVSLAVMVASLGPRELAEEVGLDERRLVRDASGTVHQARRYRRIVSASTVADRILVDLCEPQRIIALTDYGSRHDPAAHRFPRRPRVAGLGRIDRIVLLQPDLVLVNVYGDRAPFERLEHAGLRAFDLGPMLGLSSLNESIDRVGRVIGEPERARTYRRSLVRRLESIASDQPIASRSRGIYLSVVGDRLYGGTRGTSYHDVLRYAGVIDDAAEAYEGWPELTMEALLRLDPELVVTKPSMGRALCARPGATALRVCRGAGRVVELASGLLDTPGPGMLEAAEALHEEVYGSVSGARGGQRTQASPNDPQRSSDRQAERARDQRQDQKLDDALTALQEPGDADGAGQPRERSEGN